MIRGVPNGIGPRVARFLRATYPQDRAKLIARRFGVSLSTAQRWLDGHAPTTAHLEAMFALWGEPFVRALFPEAFAAHDRHAVALIEARATLMRELRHPTDLLQSARQLQPADLRWGHIWAPPAVPAPEYSSRRVSRMDERSSSPQSVETSSVIDLLEQLAQTVPRSTMWDRLRRHFC